MRHAVRQLVRSPGYTLTVVVTLALAVAANTAIFSAVRTVLLEPLPIEAPERLTVTWQTDDGGESVIELTHRHLREWQQARAPFTRASLMATHNWNGVLEGRGEPSRIWFAGVSGTFFETMGVAPLHGRALQASDDVPNGPGVAVLNHGAWVRRFGADPSVIGTTMTIDGDPMTILGVMPPDFDVPRGAEFWTPVVPILASGTPPSLGNLDTVGVFYVVGRSRPGLDAAAIGADLQAVEARLDAADPGRLRWGSRVVTEPFLDYYFGPMRSALWTLWAAVGVLLLVACANVSGLMLTRVAERQRDHSVRLALGASRRAIAKLWLIEIGLLSLAGGALGLAGASGLLGAIVTLSPDDLPRLAGVSMDLGVAAFSFAAVVAAALLASAMPMRNASGARLTEALGGTRVTTSRRGLHARSTLLVVQIALAVVLLVSAGLVVRSFVELRRIDLGFTADRVLTAEVQPRGVSSPPNPWLDEFLTRVRALPDVEAAGAIYLRPLMLGPIGQGARVFLEGQPQTREAAESNPTLNHQIATPGYFETMRIPLLAGRFFTARDTQEQPRVAIVSESTARRLWPGENPLGKRIAMSPFTSGLSGTVWRTIVGVVSDVRYRGLTDVQLDVYDPALQVGRPADNVVIRTAGDPGLLAASIRTLARELDAGVIVDNVTTMEAVVGRAEAPWRLSMWLFVLFALLAFGLAALGLFSVVALDVAQRQPEFAVRLALGSSRAGLLGGVLARAGWRVVAGVTAGLLVSVLAGRAIRRLLFGVPPIDALTYAVVLAAVIVVVGIAAYVPARRAARANPQALLREG